MGQNFVDTPATLNVIGAIYTNPKILDSEDRYFFHESDFVNDFHKILFGSIYNLHALGAREISVATIEDYLAERPTKLAIYKANHGSDYLTKIKEKPSLASFDYYYNRLKKMTLLRAYDSVGMNLSWLYDTENILDVKKKQAQEDWLDRTSLEEIADIIDNKIQEVREICINDAVDGASQLGEGIFDLMHRLKETPDIGAPLYGPLINSITRGARLKKFYLRSAATGVGKSRSMMADALYLACSSMWNLKTQTWDKLTVQSPTLFISTELEKSELQTMAVAFIAGIDEDKILKSMLDWVELERVEEACRIISEANFVMEYMPDFSLKDIENTIKRNIRENDCTYIFLDYIHTSMKILEEITRRSGGVKLREDNILFMISIQLKDLAGKYGVFIESATQLNTDYTTSKTPDQNLLRGAKAIADKTDVGMIMLDVTEDDKAALQSIVGDSGFEMPNVKLSIYKNRGGAGKGLYLWMKADKGMCRFETIFVTRWNYELVEIIETKIVVED